MANRTIAIGDIHGCADALRALLKVIKPVASDTIVTLGDYVDRGPHSAHVMDILTELISRCRLVPLLGNHEIMMTNALTSRREFEFWIFNGGKSTLQSYGGDLNNLPLHHRTFLNHCQRFYETDRHIFVHAAYDPLLPMMQQPDELLFWQHVGDGYVPDPHISGKTVICGHSPQVNGEMVDLGHIRLIDTFCYGDQWLTAMNVDTGEILQASYDGRLREPISDLSPPTPAPISDSTTVTTAPGDEGDSTASPPIDILEYTGEEFRQLLNTVGNQIANHLDQLDHYPVKNSAQGAEYISDIDEPIPRNPSPLEPLLEALFEKYIPGSYNTASPGYLAYIPGGGLPDASVADLIAATTNRYVSVWNAAPALAQIESTVIRWFCQMVGYTGRAGGFLTTGGSIANLSAIIVARVKKVGDDFRGARIYASTQTHHCIDKSAFMAGFPKANLRKIPVDSQQCIDLDELRHQINTDRAAGFEPLMMVANAGTTNTGAIDDLVELRQIADAENMWLHVDAAYGGFFMLTQRGRSELAGIDAADSVVLDPHKGLFLPYGTGCLLVKRREDLLPAFQFTSDYMPAMTGDRYREDFCEISPELSRDNRGLRIWLPMKLHGVGAFERLLEEKLELTQYAHDQLVALSNSLTPRHDGARLEILEKPRLSIVAFRLVIDGFGQAENNEFNQRWLESINQEGSVMMTGTTLNGNFVLRICVLSFRTHLERMQTCLKQVTDLAHTLLGETVI